jgi:hypothetical protein
VITYHLLLIIVPYRSIYLTHKNGLGSATNTTKPYPIHLTVRVKQMADSDYTAIAPQGHDGKL